MGGPWGGLEEFLWVLGGTWGVLRILGGALGGRCPELSSVFLAFLLTFLDFPSFWAAPLRFSLVVLRFSGFSAVFLKSHKQKALLSAYLLVYILQSERRKRKHDHAQHSTLSVLS